MLKFVIFTILFFSFYERSSTETECYTRGRFPNNETPDCRGYTMCLMGAGGYAKFDLLCPEKSLYSHIENQCTNVTSYQCLPDYNCTKEGNFVNPSDENRNSYVACVQDLRNITTARLISCHLDEVFSPLENMCVNETMSTESPKVLQVSLDTFPNLSGNFSLKSGTCINTLSYLIFSFIALIIFLK